MSYNHENLVVGCGNILYGDDGFGVEVINYIKENNIEFPGDTIFVDGGTSAPHYIFTLPESKWKNIIIIDIAQLGKKTGCIEVLELEDVVEQERYMDVHGISATYPLHDLKDRINIKIIACQAGNVPEDMEIGLSDSVKDSIPEAVDKTREVLLELLDLDD
ncbi:MAG: coenzyme F420-reducing hydrogenase, FrhD protein [Methanosphaera sp. SHI613]|jgi:coenzyme F420 hydrogenase subunit delta|nr:MAG: coenzyme F420-reducing hydrogenase, FrhD protein [Methanosphaera sp. SHI613]